MLIDEFDYILDPIKSNFNIINQKSMSVIPLFYFLYPPSYLLTIDDRVLFIKNCNTNTNSNLNEKLIKQEIIDIIKQIKDKSLVENINWGIDPEKFYAIPYRSKGNPFNNSKKS